MTSGAVTQKLYLDDAYKTVFEATVLACDEREKRKPVALLNASHFYPESGGQLSDQGQLGGATVTRVWEEDDIVCHELTNSIPPGKTRGEVDWRLRFDHMQQHTGQHVLSRAFINVADLDTVSFHMGADHCTIDLGASRLSDDIVEQAERLANKIVFENRSVKISTVARGDIDEPLLRKPPSDDLAMVRLVEIDGFDVIGCCGTHIRYTGELGMIKVLKFEKAKGGVRIYFKVGHRALNDFKQKHDVLRRIATRFTTSIDGVEEKIAKIESDGKAYRKESQRLAKRTAEMDAARLLEKAIVQDGYDWVIHVTDSTEEYIRALAGELKKNSGTIALIGSTNGSVSCQAAKDVPIDFSEVVARSKSLQGTGGGKGGFASVSLPENVDVNNFLRGVMTDAATLIKRDDNG